MDRVTINGHEYSLAAAINLMDDNIRETLHSKVTDACTAQEFVDAYIAAHSAKFGEDFSVC